jgi:hypothetical protein
MVLSTLLEYNACVCTFNSSFIRICSNVILYHSYIIHGLIGGVIDCL